FLRAQQRRRGGTGSRDAAARDAARPAVIGLRDRFNSLTDLDKFPAPPGTTAGREMVPCAPGTHAANRGQRSDPPMTPDAFEHHTLDREATADTSHGPPPEVMRRRRIAW